LGRPRVQGRGYLPPRGPAGFGRGYRPDSPNPFFSHKNE
jgi:hypothetical protein